MLDSSKLQYPRFVFVFRFIHLIRLDEHLLGTLEGEMENAR